MTTRAHRGRSHNLAKALGYGAIGRVIALQARTIRPDARPEFALRVRVGSCVRRLFRIRRRGRRLVRGNGLSCRRGLMRARRARGSGAAWWRSWRRTRWIGLRARCGPVTRQRRICSRRSTPCAPQRGRGSFRTPEPGRMTRGEKAGGRVADSSAAASARDSNQRTEAYCSNVG